MLWHLGGGGGFREALEEKVAGEPEKGRSLEIAFLRKLLAKWNRLTDWGKRSEAVFESNSYASG